MNLEQLQARSKELQDAITNTTNSVFVMQGHKAEVDFHIGQILKSEAAAKFAAEEEAKKALENPTEPPVV